MHAQYFILLLRGVHEQKRFATTALEYPSDIFAVLLVISFNVLFVKLTSQTLKENANPAYPIPAGKKEILRKIIPEVASHDFFQFKFSTDTDSIAQMLFLLCAPLKHAVS